MTGTSSDDEDGARDLSSVRLDTAAMDPLQCSAARAMLVERLAACGCQRTDDIVLVFSELATNAVLHAGGAVRITVRPTVDQRHVRIDVHDRVAVSPRPCPPGPHGGFGLGIIERLSEAWGTTPTAGGKVVWAVLPTTGRPAAGQRGQA